MHFIAKKTSSRNVPYGKEVYDAVVAYQTNRKRKDDDFMFKPGDSNDPAQPTATRLKRFFAKHGIDVLSHDFRVTSATNHYAAGKDIMATMRFLGHSSVKVT